MIVNLIKSSFCGDEFELQEIYFDKQKAEDKLAELRNSHASHPDVKKCGTYYTFIMDEWETSDEPTNTQDEDETSS